MKKSIKSFNKEIGLKTGAGDVIINYLNIIKPIIRNSFLIFEAGFDQFEEIYQFYTELDFVSFEKFEFCLKIIFFGKNKNFGETIWLKC